MRRLAAFRLALVCAALAFESPGRAADPPTPDVSAAAFDALVKKGDQARIAGKWSEALKAYSAALDIRDDPLVSGRLGLVLIEFQAYDAAVGKLFQAVEQGAGADDAERMRFFKAFIQAKSQTCRLDVIIVQDGVKLEIDGESRFAGRREGWTFVTAGKHKITGMLDGFEDETFEIDAPKGGQLNIKIELRLAKPTKEPAKKPNPEPETSKSDWNVPEDKPPSEVLTDKTPPPTNSSKKNSSFVVGFGGGFVFGATPTPAVGLNLFGAWRSRSWWEVGFDARVARTFLTDERFPLTQFVTWSAILTPCVRWKKPPFGCLLFELDGVQRIGATEGRLKPGIGVRVGLEFKTRPWMSLQLVGDVVFHKQGFDWQIPELPSTLSGSFITGTVGFRALFMP